MVSVPDPGSAAGVLYVTTALPCRSDFTAVGWAVSACPLLLTVAEPPPGAAANDRYTAAPGAGLSSWFVNVTMTLTEDPAANVPVGAIGVGLIATLIPAKV